MTSDPCRNDCRQPLRFPKRLYNRPGLGRVDYCIGTYAEIRAALLRYLDADPVLQGWTHRQADDPGIALLEGAAILGDILTFYQSLYANEAFLGTAQWRESIADLVRLLGYRLSPGLGGRATFAVGIKGDAPVAIPAGLGLKAQVEGLTKAADFQTMTEVTAYPHLSQFHLYRPRQAPQPIKAGGNCLEITTVAGKTDVTSRQALALQQGDRLIILGNRTEILVVSKVEQRCDRILVKFQGTLTVNRGTSVSAYRLGRSFRHFGHNAPAQLTKVQHNTGDPAAPVNFVVQDETRFQRQICVADNAATTADATYYSPLKPDEIPLDQPVDDLAIGQTLIFQDRLNDRELYATAEQIKQIRVDALKWGNLSGSVTVILLDSSLSLCESASAAGKDASVPEIDIRQVQFHETTSPEIILRAPSTWADGPVADRQLNYWGTYAETLPLLGRSLLLHREDGETLSVQVTNQTLALAERDQSHSWLWPITLSQLGPFLMEDFDELAPNITVYGNLLAATQGKPEKEAVLGNGDSRQAFQTFKLPNAPLTYLNSAGDTPPEVPELAIYVDNRQWTRVPSFFGQAPTAEVYIVREDAQGNSWVQFGDGKTGTRLPSGIKNIRAQYRSGSGAYGPLKLDTKVQATDKLPRLDQVWLPGVASGGTEPESGDNAKLAAPGQVQSLGRLVSLQDFEAEALGIAGVAKAVAAWQRVDNVPAVVLTVLMETGRTAEVDQLRTLLNHYNRCRGPQRFPVLVQAGQRRYLYLRLVTSLDPAMRPELLTQAIPMALGVGQGGRQGLLALSQRRFGQAEYASRIEATVQQVEGVIWTQVKALGWFPATDDPTELTYPTAESRLSVVPCGADQVLALQPQHLHLQFAAAPQETC